MILQIVIHIPQVQTALSTLKNQQDLRVHRSLKRYAHIQKHTAKTQQSSLHVNYSIAPPAQVTLIANSHSQHAMNFQASAHQYARINQRITATTPRSQPVRTKMKLIVHQILTVFGTRHLKFTQNFQVFHLQCVRILLLQILTGQQ